MPAPVQAAPVQAPVQVQAPPPGRPPAVGRPRRASLPAVTEAGCDVPAFTAQIVASYLSRNQLSPTALPGLAESVVQALVATVPLPHRVADMHAAEATAEEGHRPRGRARAPAR